MRLFARSTKAKPNDKSETRMKNLKKMNFQGKPSRIHFTRGKSKFQTRVFLNGFSPFSRPFPFSTENDNFARFSTPKRLYPKASPAEKFFSIFPLNYFHVPYRDGSARQTRQRHQEERKNLQILIYFFNS